MIGKKIKKKADMRRLELYEKIPELRILDARLTGTCSEIMSAIGSGKENAEEVLARVREANRQLLEERARLLESKGYPADHTDVKYGDTGYIDTRMCDCMKRALVLADFESSGLAGLIQTQSFENFSFDYYSKADSPLVQILHILHIILH